MSCGDFVWEDSCKYGLSLKTKPYEYKSNTMKFEFVNMVKAIM